MKNWVLKLILKNFIGPIVDAIIAVMERLAKMSENSIDDTIIEQLKFYRDYIVSFLLGELDEILRAQKNQTKY